MEQEQNFFDKWWPAFRTVAVFILLGVLIYFLSQDIIKHDVETYLEKETDALQVKIDTISAKQGRLLNQNKQVDTLIVYQVEKPLIKNINRYYYENNTINNLPDSGQFGLLSKNISNARAREQRGDFNNLPDGR